MIVYFKCPAKMKEKVDALVSSGAYPDFSTFCVTAVENQVLLEESQTKSERSTPPAEGSPVRSKPLAAGRGKGTTDSPRLPPRDTEAALSPQPGFSMRSALDGRYNGLVPGSLMGSSVSELLELERVSADPPFALPSTLSDLFRPGQPVPVDRWLFGQYNRLLPAKVSIRALAAIALEGKDALMLETAAPRVAEAAARLEDYLRGIDRRFGIHRDDTLSIAFPEAGVDGEKGRLRYQDQFVGHVVKGEQGGLLVGFKLATIQVHKNKPYIFPTSAGWAFARLPNPVLDMPIVDPPSKLSEEEVAFLLQQIRDCLPVELFAYRVMLSLVSEGLNTPELVNQGLARRLSAGKKPEEEEHFVSTQRGGVLGRMADLGLVTRERRGTRIIYHPTARGTLFLKEAGRLTVPI